jgi:hypothetical protein
MRSSSEGRVVRPSYTAAERSAWKPAGRVYQTKGGGDDHG